MITVYGATGYTGRLVCAELYRKRLPFAVAGRDELKLRALAVNVGNPEVIVAPLDDASALQKMAAHGQVVIDCAGPFSRMGKPVQDAALAAGSHFLDISGELGYLRQTHERDAEAKARKIALINSVGFDVIPTDCAAVLASEAAGAPVASVRIAFAARPMKATQGTTRSSLEHAHLGSMAWIDGQYVREPLGKEMWDAPFPAPFGNIKCRSVPWGDVATAPRSTAAQLVRVFMPMSATQARMGRWFGCMFGWRPVRVIIERWVRSLPEGPTDEERAHSSFAVCAEAVGPKGTHTAWISGANGYDFTAASAVLCAELVLKPGFAAHGALTPSQAFGVPAILDGLKGIIRWGNGTAA